jgi:hypothetical protein
MVAILLVALMVGLVFVLGILLVLIAVVHGQSTDRRNGGIRAPDKVEPS